MRIAPLLALVLAACGSLTPTAEERATCADAALEGQGIDVSDVSPSWDVRIRPDGRVVTLSYPGSGTRPGVRCVLRDGELRMIETIAPRTIAPSGPGPDELDI